MNKLRKCLIQSVALCGLILVTPAWAGIEVARISDGKSEVGLAELKVEINTAPKDIQTMILGNKEHVLRVSRSLLMDSRVAEEARAANYLARPEIQAQIAREMRNILSRTYLGDMIAQAAATIPNMSQLALERYNADKTQYQLPEMVKVAHILVRFDVESETGSETDARAKAEKILSEARAGGDFASLAKAHSDDKGSASNGGELPWSSRGKFVPPFEKASFALKPGEISGLVRSRFGFHIIKKLEHKGETTRGFDEVRESIIDKLKKDYVNEIRDKVMARFHGTKEVEITDDMMAYLRGQ